MTPSGRAATGARSSSTSGSCADRGLEVSGRAWFVYANGIRDGEAFDDVLRFRTRVIPYDGSDAWVEPALRDVADCLASEHAPAADPECAFCDYVSRASAVD